MRICIVGKYPPLQGGTSVQAFWLAYRLAEAGCEVTVVTATVAAEPRQSSFFRADEWRALAERWPAVARIRVTELADEGSSGWAIPSTDALVTRLTAAVVDAIDEQHSDAVIGIYLEPYGMAAHLAASARGLPHLFVHAGSDITRLAELDSRRAAYREVLRAADAVLTTRAAAPHLVRVRGSSEGLIQERLQLSPRSLFSAPVAPLDLHEISAALSGGPLAGAMTSHGRLSRPVIGLYGKPGPQKGIAELLAAAAELRTGGARFSILMMTGGEPPELEWLAHEIECHDLDQTVSVIPFLPHWRVPEFLATCDCVCCLEHHFPVSIHRPQIPREVATAGRCLLVSRELADGEAATLSDGENALIVDDPRDRRTLVAALRRAVLEPELRDRIAQRARTAYSWPTDRECAQWTQTFLTLLNDLSNLKRGWGMSLQAFQRTLLQIYADPVYRRELTADPAAVATIDGLSSSEAGSLQGLLGDREGLRRYCDGIVNKRLHHLEGQFSDVLSAYPSVAPALHAGFHETWVLTDHDLVSELREFERLLLHAAASTLDPEPLAGFTQWVRYAGMCARVAAAAPGATEPSPVQDDRLLVRRAPGSELARFTGRLIETTWEIDAAPWRVAAVPQRDRLQARVLELAPEVFDAVAHLDQATSLSALSTRMAGDDTAPEVQAAARASVERLLAAGLLEPAVTG